MAILEEIAKTCNFDFNRAISSRKRWFSADLALKKILVVPSSRMQFLSSMQTVLNVQQGSESLSGSSVHKKMIKLFTKGVVFL